MRGCRRAGVPSTMPPRAAIRVDDIVAVRGNHRERWKTEMGNRTPQGTCP